MRPPKTIGYKELQEDFPGFGNYGRFYHPMPEVFGEMTIKESAILSEIVHSLQPKRILEIGRCKGGSATVMALACETAQITTVDLPEPEAIYKESNSAAAHERWKKEGVSERVTEVLMDSREFWEWENFNLILLDGSHFYEDIFDEIEKANDFLPKGGACLIHDMHKRNFPGVTAAIAEWAEVVDMKWISNQADSLDTSWCYFIK